MLFSKIGEAANQCWVNIPKHYACVRPEQFVIMPNHIHGILSILPGNAITSARSSSEGVQSENANNPARSMNVGVHSENVDYLTRAHNVGVQNFEPLHYANRNSLVRENRFQHIIPRSLGSIIRGFKIGVRKWCRNYNDAEYGYFRWQRGFYDYIIRQQPDLFRIQTYIGNNVAQWKEDIENEEFVDKITDKMRRAEYDDLAKIK